MEFSTNWITEYVDLPDGSSEDGVDELADRLTAAGMAVEGRRAVTTESGEDTIFDVDVTTNRPDCMCHLGLAREAAAATGADLRLPPPLDGSERETPPDLPAASTAARLEVEDPEDCPRYVALVIRGVKVGPSPEWLADRLEAIGSRSINNVVDVTNYVLWETGQPLHAFDLATLGASDGLPQIRVRRAQEGETLVTLDDEERELDPEILVIADAEEPVALAGIMGGDDSEVGEETVDVLLESAHFDPATVRRGAARLGLHTDASHRFERGADPGACRVAAERAARLIAEIAGGRILAGHLEAPGTPVDELREDWPPRVDIDLGRLNRFGGTELDAATVERILGALGFRLDRHGSVARGDTIRWTVEAPSWRWYDFAGGFTAPHAQDVYEEVLRIHGFDRVPTTLPALGAPDGRSAPAHRLRRKVQDVLAAAGLTEAIDFAFHDAERDAEYPSLYGDREPLRLANPLSDRYDTMRRSLLPNLVESARFNVRRNAESVRLFEIGHIFVKEQSVAKGDGSAEDTHSGHDETEALALVMGGRLGTPWERRVELDLYDAKGVIEAVAAELGAEIGFRAAERPKLAKGATAEIFLEGREEADEELIGHLGRLDADDDEPYPLYVAEIALEPLGRGDLDLETEPPSRYPGIEVDTTLTHDRDVPWRRIADAVEAREVEDLVRFDMVDRYTGEGVPEGAVNTTITFLYVADDRSLTQDEVNERHQALAAHLEERFGRD